MSPIVHGLVAVCLAAVMPAVTSATEEITPKAPVHAYVHPWNTVPLQPTVYGVNNEWRQVTHAEFPAFADKMRALNYQMLRFPGGWEAEHYDWATNRTPGWEHSPTVPGANSTQAKNAAANLAFVMRTAPYIDNPTTANLDALANQARDLVLAHGDKVKHWLVGNEWWLHWGGGSERAVKLRRYATVARAITNRMKAANPAIKVYVTGDWTQPDEFGSIKAVFDANSSWPNVDGIDLHVYSGDNPALPTHYSNIAPNLADIKATTGKSDLFISEWAATKGDSTDNKRALRSVNNMVLVMHKLIRAGATAMTYWPAPDIAPGIGLVDEADGVYTDLPHGQAFRWMATSMAQHSVQTTGTPETAASHNTVARTITVLVPAKTLSNQAITVHFANTALTGVLSAQAMWMPDPDTTKEPARITDVTTTLDTANNTVTVVANPGATGRGSSYELIRLIVRYQ
ncbi:hypothetical protein F4560_003706 [Saccharothrix ecbatanensis]|uniref:Alpha-L-arabinofuranosidase n=1 Tax=Saccharothrix ecbatanensis TaxID=1105145 RepID=A0A7W9M1K6_9PSEU|nr:hypothetical protein [Saccharothrix ecbatanensis]MBB5803938.1 hypothetical protein [Saccharothrix ecbatanensis]